LETAVLVSISTGKRWFNRLAIAGVAGISLAALTVSLTPATAQAYYNYGYCAAPHLNNYGTCFSGYTSPYYTSPGYYNYYTHIQCYQDR
jgi:hypothetical protein